jgi:hypothetical protein
MHVPRDWTSRGRAGGHGVVRRWPASSMDVVGITRLVKSPQMQHMGERDYLLGAGGRARRSTAHGTGSTSPAWRSPTQWFQGGAQIPIQLAASVGSQPAVIPRRLPTRDPQAVDGGQKVPRCARDDVSAGGTCRSSRGGLRRGTPGVGGGEEGASLRSGERVGGGSCPSSRGGFDKDPSVAGGRRSPLRSGMTRSRGNSGHPGRLCDEGPTGVAGGRWVLAALG